VPARARGRGEDRLAEAARGWRRSRAGQRAQARDRRGVALVVAGEDRPGLGERAGDLQLMVVDVLVRGGAAGHDDGAVAGARGLHDRPDAGVGNDEVGLVEQALEVGGRDPSLPADAGFAVRRPRRGAVLDDELLAGAAQRPSQPHGAGEGLVVGAERAEDHRTVPA
jgi:hypothetical protein